MSVPYVLVGILIMALVTYVIRMIPMALFRNKIENVRIKSFLHYVPYTVLAAMTFPAIFTSTQSQAASAVGCIVAVALAYLNTGLLPVALGASAGVLVAGLFGL